MTYRLSLADYPAPPSNGFIRHDDYTLLYALRDVVEDDIAHGRWSEAEEGIAVLEQQREDLSGRGPKAVCSAIVHGLRQAMAYAKPGWEITLAEWRGYDRAVAERGGLA